MPNHFFTRALRCAKEEPEFFEALFESKDADPNAREYDTWGNCLIHQLVEDENINDEALPALLTTLIRKGANLESKTGGLLGHTALSLAAFYLKKNAVNYLIEQKAEVNTPGLPALNSAIDAICLGPFERIKRFEIVAMLLKSEADANNQDESGRTPLMLAAEHLLLPITQLLIRFGAKLHINNIHKNGIQRETAISIAYQKHKDLNRQREFETQFPNDYLIESAANLDFLLKTAASHLYIQFARFSENDVTLKTQLDRHVRDLAGNFNEKEDNANLYNLLEQKVLLPVFNRIKEEREQRHAFQMGSRLSKAQQMGKKTGSCLYRFFERTNGRDLVSHIFSFVHEVTPHMVNHEKQPVNRRKR
jgi:hypothetical protein